MSDELKLLVEWSSPWREFVTAIRPALLRSPSRLAGEAPTGLFPYRGMLFSWAAEAVLLIAAIIIPAKLASMRPYVPPPLPKYDIIYYSGDELPRTEDVGGAQAGRSGRAGGKQAHHRSQTIRVARGDSLREKIVDAPKLNLPKSDAAVANLLALKSIPGPPPAEGLPSSRAPVNAPQSAIAPAPEVSREKLPSVPGLSAAVIPPAPTTPQRDFKAPPLPGNNTVEVIAPPVSAPPQVASLNPKLSLPAPTVVAPPPSQIPREMKPGPGLGVGQMQKQVVPPPVQVGGIGGERRGGGGGLGEVPVVAPPVQVGNAAGRHSVPGGLGAGTSIVPPPPTVSASATGGGQGHGNRGAGRGGPGELGDPAAPPSVQGSGNGNGVILSSQPGNAIGMPGNGGAGAMAMSPNGGSQPGLGGSGGGNGIGNGNGPGSGFSGEGPGASKQGNGRGSDLMAKNGISPYSGPGGAGSSNGIKPAVPGISVQGGNSSVITLPSFGSDASNGPEVPGRSSMSKDRKGPDITVVATARSGGAFNFYGTVFKGEKVYTIYLKTVLGTVVMQFEDAASQGRAYAEELSAPDLLRNDLPANLPKSRLVVACLLDRSGMIRNAHVLEAGAAEMTTRIMAALPNWKFRPAMRGDQPVEVNAVLGFNIDTR